MEYTIKFYVHNVNKGINGIGLVFGMFSINRFPKYADANDDLLTFFNSLANATYGTFTNLPAMNDGIIPSKKYLEYIMLLNKKVTYTISNTNADKFFTFDLTPTITELGLCYSYNSEISPYNEYKLVTIICKILKRLLIHY